MRKRWILSGLLVAGLALATGSCKKKSTEAEEGTTAQAFFVVEGAVYHSGDLPEPSGTPENQPQIQEVQGNTSVVPGGSNILHVSAVDPQEDLADLLVGVIGFPGYFSVAWTADGVLTVTLTLQSELPRDTFSLVVAVEDEAGHVSPWVEIRVIVVSVVEGELQVTLTWDQPNDVDLHLVQPDSEEIFYGHMMSEEGGYLDLDSNAGCSIDGVNNEHITYPDSAVVLAGEYIVRVDYWSNCGITDTTHFSVTTRLGGNLVPVTAGSNPYVGAFDPSEADHGGEGAGREVMRFVIQGNAYRAVWIYPRSEPTLSASAQWKLEHSR